MNRRPLDAADLARRATERAGLPPEAVIIETEETQVHGDATPLGRAEPNRHDNARKPGGPPPARPPPPPGRAAIFEVSDSGPGFPPGEIERFSEALAAASARAAPNVPRARWGWALRSSTAAPAPTRATSASPIAPRAARA
jgi:hypothetical protein